MGLAALRNLKLSTTQGSKELVDGRSQAFSRLNVVWRILSSRISGRATELACRKFKFYTSESGETLMDSGPKTLPGRCGVV
jgi:hypothetical protein